MTLILIVKHFWLACIVITMLTAGLWHWSGGRHIARDPALADGYRSLIKGMVIYGNIPWVVMGVGIVFGGVPSAFHYLLPQDMNPFIPAFYGSVFLIWVLVSRWLFARGGAEMLARHPGLIYLHISSPRLIKAIWVFGLIGGILALIGMFVIMFFIEIPAELFEALDDLFGEAPQ